jgi:hypothetical protein
MKRKLFAGETSQAIPVFVFDSTKSDGSGLGGLTSSSAGLVAEYRRQGQSSWTAITVTSGTLGTYVNSGSAGTGGGFVADGSLTGSYEFCIPDAALASTSNVNWALIRLRGAINMVPVQVEIELDAINYQDGVRAGLTALPNAAAAASNGLLTAGTGINQISTTGGAVPVTGNVNVGSVTSGVIATDVWGATRTGYASAGTFGQGVASVQGPVTGSVGSVTGNVGGNVVGSVGSVTGTVGSISGVTFPTNFSVLAIAAATGQVGVDLTNIKQAASSTTLSNITIPTVSTVTAANLNMSQPIPTSNTGQTVGDSLNAARAQGFGKWVWSGTTLTLYAADGTTTVRSFTLDSATAPTQRS